MHQKASLFRISGMDQLKQNQDNPGEIDQPFGLFSRVKLRVSYERTLAIMRKYSVFIAAIFVLAIIFTVPAWNALLSDIRHSGFVQYLGLILSDFRIVLDNWQDYSLSLLESLPALTVAIFLVIILVILVAIRFFRKFILIMRKNYLLRTHH